jgi:hypothetical protein
MWRKGVTLTGIVTSLVLTGCGGGSQKAATTATKTTGTVPPSTAALPRGAPPSLRGVFGRVLTAGELAGFTPQGRRLLGVNAASWIHAEELPPTQAASEATRLEHLGFVAGVRERLAPANGGPAEGLSIVEGFHSPRAAGTELAAEVKMGKAQGASAFAVPGIPGAIGFGGASGQTTGFNVAFADAPYYYLVGAGFPSGTPNAPTRADIIAAAQHLYRRLHR